MTQHPFTPHHTGKRVSYMPTNFYFYTLPAVFIPVLYRKISLTGYNNEQKH